MKRGVARVVLALWIACVSPLLWAFDAAPRGPLAATGTVEVMFSPWQDVEPRLVNIIAQARSELFVQAFIFTSRPIAQALINAHRRGVRVAVLADAEMNGKGDRTQIPVLAAAGIPVALETRYASAHNKVILADPGTPEAVVVTGSYNFTFSARTRNAENVLVLRGHPLLAQAYLDNWRRHRRDAIVWNEYVPHGAKHDD